MVVLALGDTASSALTTSCLYRKAIIINSNVGKNVIRDRLFLFIFIPPCIKFYNGIIA